MRRIKRWALFIALVEAFIICALAYYIHTTNYDYSAQKASRKIDTLTDNADAKERSSSVTQLGIEHGITSADNRQRMIRASAGKAIMASAQVREAMAADIRTIRSQRQVERLYGPALRELMLDPNTLKKVKQLLAERIASSQDAREIAIQRNMSGTSLDTLAQDEEVAVDNEIRTLVGNDTSQKIQEMLGLGHYFAYVNTTFAEDMAFAETPLNSSQSVQLAMVLADVNNPALTPDRNALKTKIDNAAEGLSSLDLQVLQKAGAFLSPDQISVLRSGLAFDTKALLTRKSVNEKIGAQATVR